MNPQGADMTAESAPTRGRARDGATRDNANAAREDVMSAQDDVFDSALRVSQALDPARESDAIFGRIIGAVFEGDEVPAGSIILRIAVPEWTRVAAWNVTILPEYMDDEAKAEAIRVRFA